MARREAWSVVVVISMQAHSPQPPILVVWQRPPAEARQRGWTPAEALFIPVDVCPSLPRPPVMFARCRSLAVARQGAWKGAEELVELA